MNHQIALIISCEHATQAIPKAYSALFAPYQSLLNTHRGIDFGALHIAQAFQKAFHVELIQASASRLLIDCNRSLGHPHCFSEVTETLASAEKKIIIEQFYKPFRDQVIHCIDQNIRQGLQVWHLSIHSFTPIMNDIIRTADIAFLYDPQRVREKEVATRWQKVLKTSAPQYRVRMNYPYKGNSDGFTSYLRKHYPAGQYVGIEIESNQALTMNKENLHKLSNILTESLLKLTS